MSINKEKTIFLFRQIIGIIILENEKEIFSKVS